MASFSGSPTRARLCRIAARLGTASYFGLTKSKSKIALRIQASSQKAPDMKLAGRHFLVIGSIGGSYRVSKSTVGSVLQ